MENTLGSYHLPVTGKNILRFAFPTIVMTVFNTFYTMVDGLFVSNLIGMEALSAINLTAPPEPPGQALGQTQPPFAATLPFRRDDSEYAGSDSCRDCPANEHKSWHASYHRTMTQLISPETVRAAFDGQAHEFQGERFTMHRRGDEYWTSIDSIDAANASPDSHDPEALHLRLGMVTG